MKPLPLAALAFLLCNTAVKAHVVLSAPEGPAGSYYVGALRVGARGG